jgi:hypothetical protein
MPCSIKESVLDDALLLALYAVISKDLIILFIHRFGGRSLRLLLWFLDVNAFSGMLFGDIQVTKASATNIKEG